MSRGRLTECLKLTAATLLVLAVAEGVLRLAGFEYAPAAPVAGDSRLLQLWLKTARLLQGRG